MEASQANFSKTNAKVDGLDRFDDIFIRQNIKKLYPFAVTFINLFSPLPEI